MALVRSARWATLIFPHILIYSILSLILAGFVILTIIFGSLWLKSDFRTTTTTTTTTITTITSTVITTVNFTSSSTSSASNFAVANGIIGFPPRLPNDGRYVQWTILQMNDVYELLPLDQGRKGGLARVAYIRQLLLNENNNTITVLAGDLVLPSALSTANVNGTVLNGRQMIATMNVLGLDYITFGNHEFDLSQQNLLARMNESKFTWISSNVFQLNNSQPFGSSVTHKIITIDGVRILLIGYTIDTTGNYIRFISQANLINYTKEFLTNFPNTTYDVLVAITHLDMATDIQLASRIPEIDMIIGGHEHEDYYYLRGPNYTPIYKADANAFTVYIHRCAFNIDTKRFRVYSTLAKVTSEVPEENATATEANKWFNLGMQGFEALGYQPSQVVACLPTGLELDGKSESVRSSQTLLSDAICESMVAATSASGTTIGLFNSGAIRVDDVLHDTINQYDILRVLPFENSVLAISVPGSLLARVLTTGNSLVGNGMFLSHTGVETSDGGTTWLVNGVNIATSGLDYKVATIAFARLNTELRNTTILQTANLSQTKGLIDYIKTKYPC